MTCVQKIALTKDEVLNAAKGMAFHPALKGFARMQNGDLSVQNVGYPNPARSHFRSQEIWQPSHSIKYLNDGWLGRYLICNAKNTNLQGGKY
jgi:uncharacterized protein (DUF1501 family)